MIKQKDGRRNRYQIQAHLPLPEAASQEPAIGEVLAVVADLLHLSPGTAVRWVHQAGGDWSRYAAELARERVHQT